ncbi:hypothetical protein IKA15_00720 [bacterium]|nr:hypothetical protein [bacterium]
MKISKLQFNNYDFLGSKVGQNKKNAPQSGFALPLVDYADGRKFVSLYKKQDGKKPLFQGMNCSTGHFELKKIVDLECSCCGQKMIPLDVVKELSAKTEHKKGEELAHRMKIMKKYFRPIEQEVALDIADYARNHPDLSISQIVKELNAENIENLETQQKLVMDEIRETIAKFPKNDQGKLFNFVDKSENLIELKNDEKFFKRKKFIWALKQLLETIEDTPLKDELIQIAQALPNSESSASAFYAKYSRRGNNEIVRRLLTPAIATAEHIKPRSLGGLDNTANYIAECGTCNSTRSSMPYNEWFKQMPEMPENLQDYINNIAPRIARGDYPGYETYIDDIIESIKEETKGKLILKNPLKEQN